MRSTTATRVVLLVLLAAFILASWGGYAFAGPWYAGNYRNPGYGVKADISTPSSMPSVTSGIVLNMVSNYDYGYWIQVGWVQGDGVYHAPDGTPWPTVPSSYEESSVNGYYDLYLYSSQPLNYSRTYEVVHTGSGTWQGIIAGGRRYSFGPFSTPTLVEALTEIAGSTQPHTRAGFNNVQFKGLNSYMAFDQNHERQDCPPYATFYSYSRYTCYNGM